MKLFYSFAQFLISQWLWSFTFAWYHPIVNVAIAIPLLMYIARQRFVQSVLYAVSSQAFAIIFFTACVHFLLDMLLNVTFDYYESQKIIHPFVTSFLLGILYALLQMVYISILSYFWRIEVKLFALVFFISNSIAACVMYRFSPQL